MTMKEMAINAKVGEEGAGKMLTVAEFIERSGLSQASAYRLLAKEPGVQRIFAHGSSRPMIRVPAEVLARIIRRSTIPPPPPSSTRV